MNQDSRVSNVCQFADFKKTGYSITIWDHKNMNYINFNLLTSSPIAAVRRESDSRRHILIRFDVICLNKLRI